MLRNIKQWITFGLYSDSSAEPATSDKQKAKNKKRILKNEKNELKKIGHTLIFVDAIQNKLGEKSLFSTKRHGLDVLQEFLQKTLVGGNKKDEETGFRNIQRNLSEVGTGKEFVIEIGGQTVERSRDEIELHLLLNSNIKAIAEKSQVAARMTKETINRAFETSLAEGLRFERRLFSAMFATADQKEGMSAFAEKRKPAFRNR